MKKLFGSLCFLVPVLINGQISSTSLESKDDFTAGNGAWGVALGDFDGDGRKDAVVANHFDDDISVYRNTSTLHNMVSCSFDNRIDFATANEPRLVRLADFDGDGKLDIAVVCYADDKVSIFRNTSSGIGSINFTTKTDFSVGDGPPGLTIADFDGDGKQDIAVANHLDDDVSILRNTSSGSGNINFDTKVDFPTNDGPQETNFIDFDGDGKKDLVVTNYSGNKISCLLNTSSGSGNINFAAKVDFTSGTNPTGIAIGDFDADGKSDVAVANVGTGVNTISVFRNVSSGTGNISFAAKSDFGVAARATGITAEDVDCDSKIDIIACVWTTGISKLSVLENSSSGTGNINFATKVDFNTGDHPINITSGDVDGDAIPDFLTGNFDGDNISVLRSIQCNTRSYATKVDFVTGADTWGVAAGDFDGDGKNDIAVANNGDDDISVYRNLGVCVGVGSCSFDSRIDFVTADEPRVVRLGDFDGDGKLDIAVCCYGGDVVSIFRNTSSGIGNISFAAKSDFSVNDSPPGLTIADFDGDGKLDIAVTNHLDDNVSILRNTSSGSGNVNFAAKVDFATDDGPQEVSSADLDGDGKTDLIVTDFLSDEVSCFLNTSSGSGNINFGSKIEFSTDDQATGVTVADFDADGKLDIAVANAGPGVNTVSVFRSTSSGTGNINFATKSDFAVAARATGVIAEDIDGDGKIDLGVSVWTSGTHAVSVLRSISSGAGNINFATKVDFVTGDHPINITSNDVDCDAKKDIITGNFEGNSISVLRNTSTSGSISLKMITTSNIEEGMENFNGNIYPNPSNGIFNVSITNLNKSKIEVNISDLSGKILVSKIFNPSTDSFSTELDISELSQGIYIVQFKQNGLINAQKVIKH